MATIHISRADAAGDFDGLIARVSKGDEVVIEDGSSPIAVVQQPANPHLRLLSESLRILRERGATVALDDEFGQDLNEIIESHREPLINPLNDPWD
jgi:hypothetical protein